MEDQVEEGGVEEAGAEHQKGASLQRGGLGRSQQSGDAKSREGEERVDLVEGVEAAEEGVDLGGEGGDLEEGGIWAGGGSAGGADRADERLEGGELEGGVDL